MAMERWQMPRLRQRLQASARLDGDDARLARGQREREHGVLARHDRAVEQIDRGLLRPLCRRGHPRAGGGAPAVDGDDDDVARLLVAAGEDVDVAFGGEAGVAAARERGVRLANGDELLVVAPQHLVARQTFAREDVARAPRHVAAIGGPLAARPRHLLAVIDDRDSPAGELQYRRQPEERNVAVQERERAGDVVVGEVVGEKMPRPHAAARFEIAVEGDGAAAALEKGDHAAGKAEVEARVDLVRLEPGVEHLRVAAPHLAEEEETAAQLLAGAAAMLLPEFVADVLDGVEAEAVDARALRPA